MTPCRTVDEARESIRRFEGRPDEFRLAVANDVLDPACINMATVTDAILKRGWEPDGVEEKGDHRLYRFKPMD